MVVPVWRCQISERKVTRVNRNQMATFIKWLINTTYLDCVLYRPKSPVPPEGSCSTLAGSALSVNNAITHFLISVLFTVVYLIR